MIVTDFDLVSEWVSWMTDCSIPREGTAIGWWSGGSLTCGVMYEDFTGSCITATIAVRDGITVPPGFIRKIFDYPFNQAGCKKILACVAEMNLKSRALVERMGFVKEAVIFDAFPDGAMIIYSVTRELCRYLEKEHGKEDENCTNA